MLAIPSSASAQIKEKFKNIDGALSAAGEFSKSATGTLPATFGSVSETESASTSVAGLLSFRYTHSRYVGFEFNYSLTRFNETFSVNLPGGSQTNVEEYTFGYIAHLPTIGGVLPFVGIGSGTMSFEPTYKGGQALPPQYRVPVYGTIGFDRPLSNRFGFRGQFRDMVYKAPDYLQNYLTINKRTQTFEPTIGIYMHF